MGILFVELITHCIVSCSWLLKREPNKPNPHYPQEAIFDVRYGNLFDGDLTYSVLGFDTPITVNSNVMI